jgi:hypothetical protein
VRVGFKNGVRVKYTTKNMKKNEIKKSMYGSKLFPPTLTPKKVPVRMGASITSAPGAIISLKADLVLICTHLS